MPKRERQPRSCRRIQDRGREPRFPTRLTRRDPRRMSDRRDSANILVDLRRDQTARVLKASRAVAGALRFRLGRETPPNLGERKLSAASCVVTSVHNLPPFRKTKGEPSRRSDSAAPLAPLRQTLALITDSTRVPPDFRFGHIGRGTHLQRYAARSRLSPGVSPTPRIPEIMRPQAGQWGRLRPSNSGRLLAVVLAADNLEHELEPRLVIPRDSKSSTPTNFARSCIRRDGRSDMFNLKLQTQLSTFSSCLVLWLSASPSHEAFLTEASNRNQSTIVQVEILASGSYGLTNSVLWTFSSRHLSAKTCG